MAGSCGQSPVETPHCAHFSLHQVARGLAPGSGGLDPRRWRRRGPAGAPPRGGVEAGVSGRRWMHGERPRLDIGDRLG
jgi:hypothetical protein